MISPRHASRGMRVVAAALLLGGALFDSPAARAQSPATQTSSSAAEQPAAKSGDKRKDKAKEKPKHKLGPLEISGNWRLRAEGWDWFQAAGGNNLYVFPHSLLLVGLGQTGERFEWHVEAAQASILGLPSTATQGAPQGQLGLGGAYFAANGNSSNNADGFVKEAYLRFNKLGRGRLRLGRFGYLDGTEVKPKDPTVAQLVQTRIAQRLIGDFGWSAVGRSFDGAQFDYAVGAGDLTVMGGRATQGVYQVDGNGELDVDLYYGAYSLASEGSLGAGDLRIFSLGYVDDRTSVLKTDNRPLAARTADHSNIEIGTYGADYVRVFNTATAGKYDFLVWGALQDGSWGQLAQRAGAFVGEFGWQPPVQTWKPWLSAGYSFGSGDGNPNDATHGMFFQALPTPRIYARFPFYDMENNEDFYGSFNFHPHPKLAMRSEVHALRLANRNDLWYLGGGAFQPGTFGYVGRPSNGQRSLANVWDLSSDYQMTGYFSIGLYYAHAWGKAVLQSLYPKNPNAQFAYIETNLRF